MTNPVADEARALSDDELADAINEAYREVFNLNFQKGTRQLNNTMAIRKARRQLARLRTVRHERLLASIRGVELVPVQAPAEHELSPQKKRAQEERAAAEEQAAAEAEAESAHADTESDIEDAVAADPTESSGAVTEEASDSVTGTEDEDED